MPVLFEVHFYPFAIVVIELIRPRNYALKSYYAITEKRAARRACILHAPRLSWLQP